MDIRLLCLPRLVLIILLPKRRVCKQDWHILGLDVSFDRSYETCIWYCIVVEMVNDRLDEGWPVAIWSFHIWCILFCIVALS